MPTASGPCPDDICGVWKQRLDRCQSLCPLLEGLGLPKAILWAACPVVDNLQATLKISCPANNQLEIVDKTRLFGRNVTLTTRDGAEVEMLSKGRKKPFFLSACTQHESAVQTCRLSSRGPGHYTRIERFLSDTERDGTGRPMLVERHVLTRPGIEDVVVERHFESCK